MVVLPSIPGLKVTVRVKDQGLHEYTDPNIKDTVNCATRYVKILDNIFEANFYICVEMFKDFEFAGDCVCCDIYMDGTFIISGLIDPMEPDWPSQYACYDAVQLEDGSYRKFKFKSTDSARLAFISSRNSSNSVSTPPKYLGSIEVRLHHRMNIHESQAWKIEKRYVDLPGKYSQKLETICQEPIGDRSLSHTTELDPCVYVDKLGLVPEKRSTTDVVGVECPFARFVFKYRSTDRLREIMPDPRTIPSAVDMSTMFEEMAWFMESASEIDTGSGEDSIKGSRSESENGTRSGESVVLTTGDESEKEIRSEEVAVKRSRSEIEFDKQDSPHPRKKSRITSEAPTPELHEDGRPGDHRYTLRKRRGTR